MQAKGKLAGVFTQIFAFTIISLSVQLITEINEFNERNVTVFWGMSEKKKRERQDKIIRNVKRVLKGHPEARRNDDALYKWYYWDNYMSNINHFLTEEYHLKNGDPDKNELAAIRNKIQEVEPKYRRGFLF